MLHAVPRGPRYGSRGVSRAIVSCGGLGDLPRGPATAGAIAAAGTYLVLKPTLGARVGLLAAATGLGQMLSGQFVCAAEPDPDFVVIDEVAGVWAALLAVPTNAYTCGLGAIVFRLLDKLKPGVIGAVDRHGGNWSLMGDDLVAGLLTGGLLMTGAALHERFA